eukprot:Phypoly_transcript_01903.p1 GENE.Phypoly_transcript_01903~~Phypoly_transcript_01903.p1  ORF type:complete len:926 (+),score=182.85 Phypoly_transcript_01903:61-2778(+)
MDFKGKGPAKCRLCGLEGHLVESCPTPNALKTCNLCKKKGHLARACPTPEINSECRQCGRRGHTARNCNIIIWDAPRYIKCNICNEEGHGSRDCPIKKQRDLEREKAATNGPRTTSPTPASTSPAAPSSTSTTSTPSPTPAPTPAPKKEDPKVLAMDQALQGVVRARQVRLNYHTSQHLPNLASDFNPAQFAETFKAAHVDCVTVTARCHHGFLYYHSQQHSSLVHPNLNSKCNLLVEQVKALHRAGIRAPVQVSVGWDQNSAVNHPEWLQIPSHRQHSTSPSFYSLCLNTSYRELVRSIVEEIINTLESARSEGAGFDGILFDAVSDQDCSCQKCLAGVRERGGDPDNISDRALFGAKLVQKFREELSIFVKKTFQLARFGKQIPKQKKRNYSIYFSKGHVSASDRRMYESLASHVEVESPINEIPATLRYARGTESDCVVTTSKGDFHEYKTPETLEFECFRALAYGAKCNIVDQLAPNGKLCPYTYQLVGRVFEEVEKKEPWCSKAEALIEAAVLNTEEFGGDLVPTLGATTILEELGYQFDVIDSVSNFSRYKLIVLPDSIPVDAKLAAKLESFLDLGGAIIASGSSGFDDSKSGVALKSIGVQLVGPAEFSPDFILPQDNALGQGLPPTEHVMHLGGWRVRAEKFSLVKGEVQPQAPKKKKEDEDGETEDGGEESEKKKESVVVPATTPSGPATEYTPEVLASIVAPHFSRSWDHFTAHSHAPSSGNVIGPAAVFTPARRVIYFAHPIFTQFWKFSSSWTKKLISNAMKILLPTQIITTPGSPSTLLATVVQQGKGKYVIHLLHYVPRRIGTSNVDVVTDVLPLSDVRVELRLPETPADSKAPPPAKGAKKENGVSGGISLELVPGGKPLEFEKSEKEGKVSFTVPRVVGHQMVCLSIKP